MASEYIYNTNYRHSCTYVLILVLVEDGFRVYLPHYFIQGDNGLNPCSCGRWLQKITKEDLDETV